MGANDTVELRDLICDETHKDTHTHTHMWSRAELSGTCLVQYKAHGGTYRRLRQAGATKLLLWESSLLLPVCCRWCKCQSARMPDNCCVKKEIMSYHGVKITHQLLLRGTLPACVRHAYCLSIM
jgi:hypothetical protein